MQLLLFAAEINQKLISVIIVASEVTTFWRYTNMLIIIIIIIIIIIMYSADYVVVFLYPLYSGSYLRCLWIALTCADTVLLIHAYSACCS